MTHTWTETPLRYLSEIPITNGLGEAAQDGDPSWPRYIRTTDIADLHQLHDDRRVTLPPEIAAGAPVQPGDLLMTAAGSLGTSHLVGQSEPACYAGYLVRFRPDTSKVDPRFIAWWTQSKSHLDQIAVGAVRSTIDNFSAGKFRAMRVALPELPLQGRIADFLDRETAEIDAMIAKQEELVGLLGERRSAVIAHAVSKGLNPNAPMKDSGIEWLGEVPEHWETAPVKRVTTVITDGAHISPETDGGIFDFVSTRDVRDGWIDFENALKTSPASYDYLVRTGCKPYVNDVLFSKDGTVGRTVVVRQPADFVVASSLIILRPDPSRVIPDFLDLACKGSSFQEQVNSVVKGAGLPRVSIANLRKMALAVPPLEEQAGIVADVAPKVEQIQVLVAKAEESIELMRERRAALISAAVTGRLDIDTYGRRQRREEGVA